MAGGEGEAARAVPHGRALRDRGLTPVRICGAALGQRRHLCGLFNGPDDTYATLLPFIVDGLRQGQHAGHLVAPATRAAHLERLAGAGIDVRNALATGQLEVRTWDQSYLRGGRFDPVGMLLFIQQSLAQARARGYAISRLIGFMGWTVAGAARVDEIAGYEAELDTFMRGKADSLVCAYDLSQHPASLIVEVQAAHPLAVVNGTLMPTAAAELSPRDRILDAASHLFSRQGIRATGVDTLIDAAGVAKATFYRYFPSKDDLVLAWLADARTRWLDRVRRRADEIASPRDATIPAFFDAVAEWLEAEDWRGCAYLNSAAELVDEAHPAHAVIRAYLAEVRAYFADVLRSEPRRRAETLAAQVHVLLSGAISLAVAHRTSAPALEAREAVVRLLR